MAFSSKIFRSLLLTLACLITLPQTLTANPVNLQILGVSNSSPVPGSNVSVTVAFCDNTQYASNRVKIIAGLVSGTVSSFVGCPNSNQSFMVDTAIPGGIASGPGMYDPGNGSTQGGSGPPYYPTYNDSSGTNTCPAASVTAIWSVYIESNLSPGTYSFVVGAAEDYVNCTNATAYASISLTIPLPPANFTLAETAEAATAAPNGLILFNLDYSFVNTNNFVITDLVPPNTTLTAIGLGGSNSAGTLTWNLGNASTPKTGTVWFMVRVDSGTPGGTVISNNGSGQTNEVASKNSNIASSTVQVPALTLSKSQSAASVPSGGIITYNLDWIASGQNLQLSDSLDSVPVGSNTTGATVPWGFDGTNYTVATAGGTNGSWTVRQDAQGNHYIDATVAYNGTGNTNHYPELIRDVPGLNICSDFIVEGDMEIPPSAPGAGAGADAHMVLAVNPSQGITLKAAISTDTNPGNLFLQKNNIFPLPAGASTNVPFGIAAGQWYTLRTRVNYNGSSGVAFTVQIWPKNNPAAAFTFNYTDVSAPLPTCSGGWRQGWQVDETAGEDWFSGMKVFGPGPIVNSSLTDVIPAGMSYLGSSLAPASGPSPLVWDFPATVFSLDTPIHWWGSALCPGPIVNQFSMTADSIASVNSNIVSCAVTGSCLTPTYTPTGTITHTPTNTPTVTLTPTPTNTLPPTPVPFDDFYVAQNYFNPATGAVSIYVGYSIYPGDYSLKVFNSAGEEVKQLAHKNLASPLTESYSWDGTNEAGDPCASGVYILYLVEPLDRKLKKVVLIR